MSSRIVFSAASKILIKSEPRWLNSEMKNNFINGELYDMISYYKIWRNDQFKKKQSTRKIINIRRSIVFIIKVTDPQLNNYVMSHSYTPMTLIPVLS